VLSLGKLKSHAAHLFTKGIAAYNSAGRYTRMAKHLDIDAIPDKQRAYNLQVFMDNIQNTPVVLQKEKSKFNENLVAISVTSRLNSRRDSQTHRKQIPIQAYSIPDLGRWKPDDFWREVRQDHRSSSSRL